jgi:hypothetical protein
MADTKEWRRCLFPWSHNYGPWTDTHTIEKRRTVDNAVVAFGFRQESRCAHCGKLRVRNAMK